MSDARLTHPVRGTLEFRQRQQDEDPRQSQLDVFRMVGTDSEPLVHIRTRERQRTINGTTTGLRRARNDPDTSDPEQALANYVDLLESHVDEFQGDGYTFEDDLRNLSLSASLESVTWTYQPDQPYQIEFEANVVIGRGVFEERDINRRNPTIDTSKDVLATVNAYKLPGVDEMRVQRDIALDPNAIYAKGEAQNNDLVPQDGALQRVTIRGTHSGSDVARRTADSNLGGLEGGGQVTLDTRFPGYSLDGFVIGYTTTDQARRGGNQHQYELEFIEGTPS